MSATDLRPASLHDLHAPGLDLGRIEPRPFPIAAHLRLDLPAFVLIGVIPVSSEISELWVGGDPVAGKERWAFAFSAKKTWKSKVADDVRNIAKTNRGYSQVCEFIQ